MKWALALLLFNSLGFWSELGDLVVAIPNGLVSILTGVGKMLFGARTSSEYDTATGFPRCNSCGRTESAMSRASASPVAPASIANGLLSTEELVAINQLIRSGSLKPANIQDNHASTYIQLTTPILQVHTFNL
ncbi:hypothetical protein Ddc_10178 [Ditylenchus destructor]|nr:hypothetical protein Ddc_10178 [Ditylenchus destructor]